MAKLVLLKTKILLPYILSQRVPQAASSDRRPLDLRSVTDSLVTELAA
jgi:hypothetical protein